MSSGPSSCVYREKLYCFYSGSLGQDTNGNALFYNVFDGESWAGERQVPATNIAKNPSAVVFEGMIYVFHEGNLANEELWYNRFDGSEWLEDVQIPAAELSWGPGATNHRRSNIRELLQSRWIYASSELPPLDSVTFTIPPVQPVDRVAEPDDAFNWENRKNPPRGWGMTGVVTIATCKTNIGELPVGSIIIYPGIRMSKQSADNEKKYYTGLIQFNGEQGAEPLYQDRGSRETSLHGRLVTKLMPPEYTDGFYSFKRNFLGFALDGQSFRFKNISYLLNREWFYRVYEGKQYESERMSADWSTKLRDACEHFFPGVSGKPAEYRDGAGGRQVALDRLPARTLFRR